MAKLDNIIKSQLGLAKTSAEEMAAQQGRAAPIQPLEGAVLGANKDQAKMLGSRAQKGNAVRAAIQGETDLATALRRGQTRQQATEAEKAQMGRAGQLGQLSSLEERVEALGQQQIAKTWQDLQNQEALELQIREGETDELQALLERIRNNPEDMAAVNEVNRILAEKGKLKPGELLGPSDLLAMYDTSGEAQIAEALKESFGENVAEALNIGALPIEELGFQNIEELAGLLKMTAADLQQMDIPSFIDSVNAAIQEEQSIVNDLQAKVNDMRLGAAERAEARQRLRDLGAIGVSAANTELDRLAEAITGADTIEFGGEERTVEELLSDSYLSGVVSNFLDGLDPDSGKPITEASKKFKESQPEFAKFIESNRNMLQDAASQVEESVKQYAKIQEENKDTANISSDGYSATLPDKMMKKLFPEWGTPQAEALDANQYQFLRELKSGQLSAQEAQNLVETANSIMDSYPQYFKEFANFNRDELTKAGLLGDTIALGEFKQKLADNARLEKIAVSENVGEELSTFLKVGSLDNLSQELRTLANLGEIDMQDLEEIPGLIDGNWAEMAAWMNNQKPDTLRGTIDQVSSLTGKLDGLKSAATAYNKLDIPEEVRDMFADDDKIDIVEFEDVYGREGRLDLEDLEMLSKFSDHLDPEVRRRMDKSYSLHAQDVMWKKLYETTGSEKGWDELINRTKKTFYDDPAQYENDRAQLRKLMGEMETLKEHSLGKYMEDHINKQFDTVEKYYNAIMYKEPAAKEKDKRQEINYAVEEDRIARRVARSGKDFIHQVRDDSDDWMQDDFNRAISDFSRGIREKYEDNNITAYAVVGKTPSRTDSFLVSPSDYSEAMAEGKQVVPIYGSYGSDLIEKYGPWEQQHDFNLRKNLINAAWNYGRTQAVEAGLVEEIVSKTNEAKEQYFKERQVDPNPLPPAKEWLKKKMVPAKDIRPLTYKRVPESPDFRRKTLVKYTKILDKYPHIRDAMMEGTISMQEFYNQMPNAARNKYSSTFPELEKKLKTDLQEYKNLREERKGVLLDWDKTEKDILRQNQSTLMRDRRPESQTLWTPWQEDVDTQRAIIAGRKAIEDFRARTAPQGEMSVEETEEFVRRQTEEEGRN